MRKTFAKLDDVLIERVFQPACDMITARAGLTRATSACFFIDAASLGWIGARARSLAEAVDTWAAATAFFDIAILLLGLVALVSLRTVFRRAANRKPANPLRLAMQPHRAVVLLMLLARLAQFQGGFAGVADLAMLLCVATALYLGACVEAPPLRRPFAPSLSASSRA